MNNQSFEQNANRNVEAQIPLAELDPTCELITDLTRIQGLVDELERDLHTYQEFTHTNQLKNVLLKIEAIWSATTNQLAKSELEKAMHIVAQQTSRFTYFAEKTDKRRILISSIYDLLPLLKLVNTFDSILLYNQLSTFEYVLQILQEFIKSTLQKYAITDIETTYLETENTEPKLVNDAIPIIKQAQSLILNSIISLNEERKIKNQDIIKYLYFLDILTNQIKLKLISLQDCHSGVTVVDLNSGINNEEDINIGPQHIFMLRVLLVAAKEWEILLRDEDPKVLEELVMRALAYPIKSIEEALKTDTYNVLHRFDHNPQPIESPIRPVEEAGNDPHLENLIESGLVRLPQNFFELNEAEMTQAYKQALLHIATSHFSVKHRIMAIRLLRDKVTVSLGFNYDLIQQIESITIEILSSPDFII